MNYSGYLEIILKYISGSISCTVFIFIKNVFGISTQRFLVYLLSDMSKYYDKLTLVNVSVQANLSNLL